MAGGVLWLFVFGDEPWPEIVGVGLMSALALMVAALWGALLALAYAAGKRAERRAFGLVDVIAPLVATAALVMAAAAHQLSVGNIGPVSDTTACSRLCQERGFAVSGMPPRESGDRTCTCYDAEGREALRTRLNGGEARRR
jgi:hypothetical protein